MTYTVGEFVQDKGTTSVATEFMVRLEHRPGALAELGEALGKHDVNIDAFLATVCDAEGVMQFVPNDPEHCAEALSEVGIQYTTREVLIVNILDEPGKLGDVARVMASAGINIDATYVTLTGKIVLGVDDLVGATQVVRGMAVM